MIEEPQLPPEYDQALLRAAKGLAGLGLTEEQLEAVLNVINEVTFSTYKMVINEMKVDVEVANLEALYQLDKPEESR